MWWSFVWVENNPKYFMSWLLLADTNQRLYRIGQEVPPMSDLLSEDEGTPLSHVSCHHSWSLHQVGDWLHYMQTPFNKGSPLYHRSSKLLHEVGRGYATFKDDGKTTTLFLFNQIIARFGVPREIVTDHGSHFQNKMMTELTSNLGLRPEHSSPYYP